MRLTWTVKVNIWHCPSSATQRIHSNMYSIDTNHRQQFKTFLTKWTSITQVACPIYTRPGRPLWRRLRGVNYLRARLLEAVVHVFTRNIRETPPIFVDIYIYICCVYKLVRDELIRRVHCCWVLWKICLCSIQFTLVN